MKILSNISAVEVRFKNTLNEERKIEVVQGCIRDNYAPVIVVADRIVQIKSGGTCSATALEFCKAMKKTWQIAGQNDENEEDDDNDHGSKWLEILLGAIKQKWSSGYQKLINCNKRGHTLLQYPDKKKKGGSEKAGATAVTSIKKMSSKCIHCSGTNHSVSDCWKKYPHKVPRKSSMDSSGAFLEKELLVCNIKVDNTYYTTEIIEDAHYCSLSSITDDGQWKDLECWMVPADLLMADPYKRFYDVSSKKKTDDEGLNDWLKLQE
jgi:hypothetical protein